jgi:ABC-type Co2+ transport system permease subunit
MLAVAFILASFTSPEKICTNPQSMLWLLPLVAAIAVVYKATKVPTIKISSFLKETVILFGSIVVFMLVTALVLYALARLITE